MSLRRADDNEGYGRAAEAMAERAAAFPGCLGFDSARGQDGLGITVSYWVDEASARAWKGNAEHALIRQFGRERWYACYRLIVATVDRTYGWTMGG